MSVTIYNSYNENEKGYVKILEIYTDKEWVNVSYPEIKLIYFMDIYRGIDCWSKFNEFLKGSFPNLEVLILSHDYTLNQDQDTFIQFMNDPWLKHIFIYTLQDRFSFQSTPTRMYHDIDICTTCSKRKFSECGVWKQNHNMWKQCDQKGIEVDLLRCSS